MASENDRLAQIFIWKQAGTSDIEYARQVLSVVNPGALPVLASEDPPIRFFTVFDQWPEDPWSRALSDLRASSTPNNTQWADTTRFDLAGWQGVDQSTGDRLFIVTAYRKSNGPPADAFQVEPAPAPSYTAVTVPQVPYYPQHPTGPLNWPPEPDTGNISQPYQGMTDRETTGALYLDNTGQHLGAGNAPQQAQTERVQANSGQGPQQDTGDQNANTPPLSPLYNRAIGGQVPALAASVLLPDSYAPYYVGFGPRLIAGLLDLFFMGIFQIGTLFLLEDIKGNSQVDDPLSWLRTYGPVLSLSLGIFAAYQIIQWTIWGRTLGKAIMGIRVVGADGERIDFMHALVRMLGYFFSLSIGGIGGFLMIAFDPRRQGLHDKLAETYVIPDRPKAVAPRGLPGYATENVLIPEGLPTRPTLANAPATASMAAAAVAGNQTYESLEIATGLGRQSTSRDFRGFYSEGGMQTVAHLPEMPDDPFLATQKLVASDTSPSLASPQSLESVFGGPITGPLASGPLSQRQPDRSYMTERARELYRQGITQMANGVQPSARGYKVEPASARLAALAFKGAVELVPNSVVYRYLYGVALRYAEGFEIAISEFRHVLDLDPNYYEARQQVTYGPRWHDAFAYTPWMPTPIEQGGTLPEPLRALLSAGQEPITRLALLRESTSKVTAVLTRTPRNAWARPLTAEIPAHIDITLSRTPHGPIIAFYLIVEDKPNDPYKGETFLNPHDPGYPTFDACQLGQNLVAQLSRQDHTHLIFVDENNKLILSRRLDFDPYTQVRIAQCLYDIQTLPAQTMDAPRFHQAAQWHMQNFSLDQIR